MSIESSQSPQYSTEVVMCGPPMKRTRDDLVTALADTERHWQECWERDPYSNETAGALIVRADLLEQLAELDQVHIIY